MKTYQQYLIIVLSLLACNVYGMDKYTLEDNEQLAITFAYFRDHFLQDLLQKLRADRALFVALRDANQAVIPNGKQEQKANELDDNECVICFDTMLPEDRTKLTCGHTQMHSDCIIKWSSIDKTCPLCRKRIVIKK